MVPYPTKSAVYAVEQSIVSILSAPSSHHSQADCSAGQNMIYAGTRGGKVLVFDRRSSRPQYRYTDGAQPSHPRPVRRLDHSVGLSGPD